MLFRFCLCMMLAVLQGCSGGGANADPEFAKTAFQSLARGDSSAEEVIDWETFQSMGQNVGMIYIAMPNDTEKANFRKSFIAQFSSSFQSTGASADGLKNWRVQSKDSARTIIAADTPNNTTLLITVSKRDGKQKISALNTG